MATFPKFSHPSKETGYTSPGGILIPLSTGKLLMMKYTLPSTSIAPRLFGGKCTIDSNTAKPCGRTGSVEVYDEKNNTWSVVDQPHIPPNNLGAIEVEGSVYFIINSFPVDSGIRIPPGEVYSVSLDEWEDLGRVHQNAIFCLVPVKTESLTSE